MDPFTDPNNHAQEVRPGDDWGDAEGSFSGSCTAVASLPPRRKLTDRAGSAAGGEGNVGLRIGSNVMRREAPETPQRLEVQEISGEVIRLEQPAEAPQRVVRQVSAFQQKPEKQKARTADRHWGVAKKLPLKWVIGGGTGVTVLVIFAVMMLPRINKPNAARAISADRRLTVVEEVKVEGIDALNQLVAKMPEAEQLYRAFVKAKVVDEVIPLIRDASGLEETVRENWRPIAVPDDWTPKDASWNVSTFENVRYGILEGIHPDFSKFSACFTFIGGRLLMDWKATTAYSTATFSELSNNEGDPSEVRAIVQPSNFYTSVWPESDYLCFQLISPAGEVSIWGYAKRTDPVCAKLASLYQSGEVIQEGLSLKKMTVRLERGPAGAAKNQWLIADMLHIDWMTP
jgi:hypothetical protein